MVKMLKRKLKESQKQLHQSKQQEQKEVQMLSAMLTNVHSAKKTSSKKNLVLSPEFRRSTGKLGNFSARGLSRNTNNDYNTILNEINTLIDRNSTQLSGPPTLRGILKNPINQNLITSPSVGELHPSAHGTNLRIRRNSSKENTAGLTMS